VSPIAHRPGERRRTAGASLAATAVAALLSGTPSTVHSLATRRPVLATVRAAAALVRPGHGDPLSRSDRVTVGDLLAGGIAHAGVSLFWGTVLARLLPPGRRALWGAAAGAAIHVIDLGLVARLVPRLAPMRRLPQLPQLGDHIAFGVTLGFVLDRLDPPSDPPSGSPGQATSSRAAG
jgi:hypothetical protein